LHDVIDGSNFTPDTSLGTTVRRASVRQRTRRLL